MGLEKVSRRVNVTLPDDAFEALDNWAELQGRPTANLAAFIIETAIREAIANGTIEDPTKKRK